MTMLRDLLTPFQSDFSGTRLGRERSHWFIFTLLAIIVPFTSSEETTSAAITGYPDTELLRAGVIGLVIPGFSLDSDGIKSRSALRFRASPSARSPTRRP